MMRIAVQHQTRVERYRVVVILLISVVVEISFARIALLVVDRISIQHLGKNVVTLKVVKKGHLPLSIYLSIRYIDFQIT